MEWPRVVVFGADRGTMPHDLSDDVEEERRVFHVAITRAVDQVVVLADEARPSRFLGEMAGVVEPAASQGARVGEVGGRRSARAPRRRLDVFVGDQVEVMGGYSGAVVAVNGDGVSVRLETGADLIVPVGEIRSVVPVAPAPAAEADPALVEALRRWRREVSAREGVPAYVVFHDTTLEAIAAVRPSTERQLIGVPGIGPAKLERYGDEILALVQMHSRTDT
jgi:superfamily II DNA helicase RecQ